MYHQKNRCLLIIATICLVSVVFAQSVNKEEAIKPSQILIQPEVTRSIQGYTILDRKKYFNLCDQGTGFENRVSKEIYTELVQD